MITITVASYNGAQLAQPLAAHFDEMGGNIGRAENNQLVLPDPERTISRVHAQIAFRGGRYAIVDRGSNPVSVNGRPLGNGQEALLQPGDEIAIGGYVMRVDAGGAASGHAAADPFADFAGLAAAPSGGMPARGAPATSSFTDPLAGFGMAPNPPPAYSAPPGFAPAPAHAAAPLFGAAPPSAASAGGIPADWDPFAPDPVAKPRADDFARSLGQQGGGANLGLEIGGRAAPLIPDMPGSGSGSHGGADSLDNLFGLSSAGSGDPLAGSLLAPAAAQPNMAAHADPLKSLNSITKGSGQAAADTLPELQSPFMPPSLVAAAAAAPVATRPPPSPLAQRSPQQSPSPAAASRGAVPPRAEPAATPKGAVLSWDDPSGESRTVIRPRGSVGPGASAATPPAIAAELDLSLDFAVNAAPAGRAAAAARPLPVAAAAPPADASPATPADLQTLSAALREGLGVEGLAPGALELTPELMRLLGQLLHEATRGTVDLLVARAALKREIRAEVTMIVTRENNPLKFSPSVDVALSHLLNPPARGFMAPDRAMRDAYEDLRAHQFGFLAGMRAALEGVLRRFDPAVLESKLTQKSVLSSLLPAGRKARMWDVFTDLYGQISAEAADDFHQLFGKEFLRAYEEYIDQLAQERP